MMYPQAVENMSIVASSTNTSSAINVMRNIIFSTANGDRPDVNNVGIVITDGLSDSSEATAAEALAAKAAGVRMYAIGLTDEIDAKELKNIASVPVTEHYFNRTSISLVQTVTSQLLWSVCHDPCSSSADGTPTVRTSACRHNASCEISFCFNFFEVNKFFYAHWQEHPSPNSHDATLPLPPLPSYPFPSSPLPFNAGSGV